MLWQVLVQLFVETGHVAAGHETAARALDHDNANAPVGFDFIHGVPQRRRHFGVEGVQNLRPVQGNGGDGVLTFDEHGAGHRLIPLLNHCGYCLHPIGPNTAGQSP